MRSKRQPPRRDYQNIDAADLKRALRYDPLSGEFTRLVAYGRYAAGSKVGTKLSNGYINIGVNGFMCRAHRLAWFYMTGRWPQADLDHINGNRADNRLRNLREASRSQNLFNLGPNVRNTTGVKGVSLDKKSGKYLARLKAYGVSHRLGLFPTIEAAASAHAAKAAIVHGKFARQR